MSLWLFMALSLIHLPFSWLFVFNVLLLRAHTRETAALPVLVLAFLTP